MLKALNFVLEAVIHILMYNSFLFQLVPSFLAVVIHVKMVEVAAF